ncbi:MAG: thiamine-phosphate kinase [Gammaproteobacteria bacterium]|nr:MAG: thiamine-phosphate kinase [Gammaproteobacteria bacterium]
MDEFELIRRFFLRDDARDDVPVGVGDDGAVLRPAAGRDLLSVVDSLVEGVHFPAQLAAADIGYRAVAVNLSDIAAMAGRPRWMTLALTLPQADEQWLQDFAAGLFEAADEYGVVLVGGDTTRGPCLVVTVQILGDAAAGQALRRCGARAGEGIYVSGTPGDAAAGLALLQQSAPDTDAGSYLMQRFRRPSPRVALGQAIAPLASAAIDLSDGLLADLGKLLQASAVGGRIDAEKLPLSAQIAAQLAPGECLDMALHGGDDYELCFTAPAAHADRIGELAAAGPVALSCIGEVVAGTELICRQDGKRLHCRPDGYRHFGNGQQP